MCPGVDPRADAMPVVIPSYTAMCFLHSCEVNAERLANTRLTVRLEKVSDGASVVPRA